ncbi:hypothetical protein ABID52_001859 [Fictibacillus halophilus]|uniref:Spo0E like sporulation regulatory protein n=1 Tax=Fictibacillus halophilus TaxID=1610490 RepID=A0ABV2LI74_9BACL|nr:Spo0E family sporulation regulatory protein-aspartic acid phosphatase [Fictibacillus halophilus]
MNREKYLEDKELKLKDELSLLANEKGSLSNPDVVKKSQELDQVITAVQEKSLKNKSGK